MAAGSAVGFDAEPTGSEGFGQFVLSGAVRVGVVANVKVRLHRAVFFEFRGFERRCDFMLALL